MEKSYSNLSNATRSLIRYCLSMLLLLPVSVKAQDNLMAEGNKSITLAYGLFNVYRSGAVRQLNEAENNFRSNKLGDYSYKAIFTNPFTISFDYAYRDNTAFGVAFSYFSFAMSEDRKDAIDDLSTTLRGFYFSLSGRATRYLIHRPRFCAYLFGGGGVKIRSQSSNAESENEKKISYLFQSPLTTTKGFPPLFWEAGIGMKIALSRKIALMAEISRTPAWGNIGLSYIILHKSRRKADRFGW